jgi:predicted negative regulator of RcsB-dependent stress response
MMRFLLPCLLLLALHASAVDYVAAREQAETLANQGKAQEAREAYLALASDDLGEVQRSDALTQAAFLSDRLNEFDRALELARQIPLPYEGKATEIQLLAQHRRWLEILERFGGEDLTRWPDTLVGNAAYNRGLANRSRRNGEAALADLKLASETLLEDNVLGLAFISLGEAYSQFANDDDQALACFREVYKRRNVTKRAHAAMSAAAILRKRKQFDAALKELAVIPMKEIQHAYWRSRMLVAWGAALADAGQKAEAIAKYREALRVEGVDSWAKETSEAAIARLEGANQ